MYQLVGVGNALMDMEFVVDETVLAATGLDKGQMTLADTKAQNRLLATLGHAKKHSSGGSGANTITAFACLGGRAYYHCRVGADPLGVAYLDDLTHCGVATNPAVAQVDSTPTGSCVVLVSGDGERTMQTHLGVSQDFDATNIAPDTLSGQSVLYLEGYLAMNETALAAIAPLKAQATKVAVSFADPAVVEFAKAGLCRLLAGGVAIVFCNLTEARLFTGKDSQHDCAKALLAYAQMVVITAGGKATLIAEQVGGDYRFVCAGSVPVAVVDSNGAGDNYAGAFLYAHSLGYDVKTCARLAAMVAAQVVASYGARLAKDDYQEIKTAWLATLDK